MPTIDINGSLVDFPDDLTPEQLQSAVASAASQMGGGQQGRPSMAEEVSTVVQGVPSRPMTSPAGMVKRLAMDTILPFSGGGLKRMANPMPGQFGPLRTLQDIGEQFPPVQELAGQAADKLSESRLGQLAPIPTAAAGATGYALSHILPRKLTPSEAAQNIGAEGAGMGVKMLRRPVAALGRGIARGAEGISGLEYKSPGVLSEAANDSSLMFGPGKQEAGKAYEKLSGIESVRDSIGRATSAQGVIDEGLKAIDDGSITHTEALVARQAVDKAKNSLPKYTFNNLRSLFDDVAKKVAASADEGYKRAVKSEALRLLLPVNKSGGTSIAKGFLGTIAGVAPAMAMSPAVQGGAATLTGIAGRQVFGETIPAARAALSNLLSTPTARQALVKALSRRKEKQNAR